MKAAVWKILLKYGLGLGALAFVLIDNWQGMSSVFERRLRITPLILAAIICVVALIITFLRWHMLVRTVKLEFSRYDAIRLGLAGYFFNTFLPGSVGGDILKAYYIARDQERRTRAVATVIVDRVLGLWALALFVALSGGVFWLLENPLFVGENANKYLRMIVRTSVILTTVTLAIFVCVGFFSHDQSDRFSARLRRIPKVGASLSELWEASWMYRQQPRAVLLAVVLSLIGHVGWVLIFHLTVHAFDTPESEVATLPEHMIIVPVGMTAQALFPAPGGVGGGELAYGELYHILGKDRATGIAACLTQRVIFMGWGVLGYLLYLRMRTRVPGKEKEEPLEAPPPEPAEPIAEGVPGG